VATDLGRGRRQAGLQPGEPRLPDLRSCRLSSLSKRSAAQRGVRPARGPSTTIFGSRVQSHV